MLFAAWLELLFGLRWDNVVMSVKIKDAFTLAITDRETSGCIACRGLLRSKFKTLAWQAEFCDADFKQFRKLAVIPARGILRRHGYQIS